jgi:hypothetical protein
MTSQTQTKSAGPNFDGDVNRTFVAHPFTLLRKVQPQAVKTAAGIIKFEVTERPAVWRVEENGWIGYSALDWQNKIVEYHTFLPVHESAGSRTQYARTGSAVIYYGNLADGACNDNVLRARFAETASDHARVVLLSDFYPFGIVSEKYNEYKQKGVGSALLKLIRDDCASEGASFIYCYVITPEMDALARKFGFESLAQSQTFFLKLQCDNAQNANRRNQI